MAILKNLIVNGASRFLQKAYFDDIEVGGTTTISNLDADVLNVSGNAKFNGNTYLYGNIAVYSNAPKINFHYKKVSTTTSSIYETQDETTDKYWLNIYNNLKVPGTADVNQLIVNSTSNFGGKVKIDGDVDIIGNLRWSTIGEHMTIQNLGGTLLVAPTIYQSNNTTINVTAKTNNSVTFTITDSSMITGTTVDTTNNTFISGGANWRKNSLVKVSGKIGECVLGASDGEIYSINVSNYQMTITATIANAADIEVRNYSASEISDFAVMLYKLHNGTNLFPIGIVLTSYGSDRKSYIDVYGGTSATPVARMGNLGGLTYKDYSNNDSGTDTTLTNQWGFYAKDDAYFEGKLVTNSGKIGGWVITSTNLHKGAFGTDTGSIYLIPDGSTDLANIGGSGNIPGWAITSSNTFGVTIDGKAYMSSGKIGGWNITATKLSHGSFADANNASVFLIPAGSTTAANIGGYGQDTTGWIITSRNTFGVNANGGMYCSFGKIGGWNIDTDSIFSGDNKASGAAGVVRLCTSNFSRTLGGTSRSNLRFAISNRFGVNQNGILYATGAVISGDITATTGKIGNWNIADGQLSYTINDTDIIGDDRTAFLIPGGATTTKSIGGSDANDTSLLWTFTSGNNFGVTNKGAMYCTSGKIGGWKVDTNSIFSGEKWRNPGSDELVPAESGDVRLSSADFSRAIGGQNRYSLRLAIGSKFGVSTQGKVYMSDALADKFSAYKAYRIYGDLPAKYNAVDGYVPLTFDIIRGAAALKNNKSYKNVSIGTSFLDADNTIWSDVRPQAGISIVRDLLEDENSISSIINMHAKFINLMGENVEDPAITPINPTSVQINGTMRIYGSLSADSIVSTGTAKIPQAISIQADTSYNLQEGHVYLLITWHNANYQNRSVWVIRGGTEECIKLTGLDDYDRTSGGNITITFDSIYDVSTEKTTYSVMIQSSSGTPSGSRLIDLG